DRYLHFKDLPYLIRDHSVRYSYSAGLIEAQKEQFAKWHPRLLAFAPDYVDGKGKSLLAYTGQRQGYEPLPGVAEEVMSIARFMPGKIILGRKATKTAFNTFANDYDVLHLAMHAVINDENPMFSTLVFASDNPGSSMGLLNTFEIYNQDLHARMAVLSACNTGKGQLRKGEGMISLARGFAYAGVPSIVMTLWSVNDNSSAKLMTGFYSFLAKGADKASSLRNAKLNYIQQASVLKSHPFYWAGYVLTGSNSPLYLSGTSYIPLAGLLLIVLVLLYVWKRFKRRGK
ncbi:MAG: CHAT domain-containing protein, partial [Bacteroidota bacterium]|nr:CHAT domain-containing protein [Bacteroidota bacterium]